MATIVAYLVIVGFLRLVTSRVRSGRGFFIVVSVALLWVMMSLRTVEFGPDVVGYVSRYSSLDDIGLSEVLERTQKDPVFWALAKLLNSAGLSSQGWLSVIAGAFCLAVGVMFYKYSPEPFMSLLALIVLGYLFFSLTGLRQTLAISFVILSFESLRTRRLLPFAVLIAVGSLFHSSALVFLVAYPASRLKLGWRQLAIVGAGVAFATLFEEQGRQIISDFGWTDSLGAYAYQELSLSWSGFAIHALIFAFLLYFSKSVLHESTQNISFYNTIAIGLGFLAYSTVIAESFRASMYFTVFSCVALPMAIFSEERRSLRAFAYLVVMASLFAYILWSASFEGFELTWP